MKSVFERLGLPVKLVFSEEEIREAYREKARVLHPDQGGCEVDFSALQVAQSALLSPVSRVMEWAKARDMELIRRGAMDVDLMDLFERVSEALRVADLVARQREGAKSALARALTEGGAHEARENIELVQCEVQAVMVKLVAKFSDLENGVGDVSAAFRHLIFVEKWQGYLRQMFGRLL